MTCVGTDEVLSKLSIKYNRIFYEREFVESVSEDFKTIINNKDKCCVLVFPTLSPNYLRVVRYQAKLNDLAVISLGSGCARSVGICHKKYFLPSVTKEGDRKEETPSIKMAHNSSGAPKRKRPPIQLYVPPAQRKSIVASSSTQESIRKTDKAVSTEKRRAACKTSELHALESSCKKASIDIVRLPKNETTHYEICYCKDNVDLFDNKSMSLPFFSTLCNCAKLVLFKDLFPYAKLLIFSIKRIKHSFHWIRYIKMDSNFFQDDLTFKYWILLQMGKRLVKDSVISTRFRILVPTVLDLRIDLNELEEHFRNYQNANYLCGNKIFFYLPRSELSYYISNPSFDIFDNLLSPDDFLHSVQFEEDTLLSIDNYINNVAKSIVVPRQLRTEELDLETFLVTSDDTKMHILPSQNEMSKIDCDIRIKDTNTCAKQENIKHTVSIASEKVPSSDRVIVLESRTELSKFRSPSPIAKNKSIHNEHEQEKEIMRKAKQNINRKTRPIIKYVDDDNDTLKIGKGDNINNWEDLLNDDGELLEDIFTEIVQKVGPEVTIVKANEDYTAYASKQAQELEHMVELYDFPASLETPDIIAAFSEINSDSMYIKWVDDTHAILVLGSSIQAQKAIELASPMIKVRPMSAASSIVLEKANQFDLKPAMKRPQTNLQTARRLITSHLGAKSKVSREQTIKEKEDLRLAKEQKKKAKQNEKDAWEGKLRSSIN